MNQLISNWSKKYQFCLVCYFLPILKQNFCWFSSKVLTTKYFILHRFKIDPQKGFFYTPHPWGKSTKVFFQKWQKTAYQTSSNRSILMVFDRFNDVWLLWYAVFCQFSNKTFVDFPEGYWQQNISFYIDLKSTPKKVFFIRHILEKNQQKFSSKNGTKLHTKHHQIDQLKKSFPAIDHSILYYILSFLSFLSTLLIY